ncbi:MAG TPA: hypothetical protein VGJ92_05950 [Methanocella sp.]|jgi:hypothetical protein
MRPDPKLSSNNEFDIKFIVMFTVAFVVIAGILLVAGYAVMSATGIIGHGAGEPTPTAAPGTITPKPTYVAIGVPTEIPCPTPTPKPPTPTPTPSPTPVPSPYKIAVLQDQGRVGSMSYSISFSMVPGYQPLDLTHTVLTIKDWETTYCEYDYNAMMYYLNAVWTNSNNDTRLDPIGELVTFEISAYSLKIPLDRETKLTLSLDGVNLVDLPLPSFQNQADLPDESPDPGSGTGQSSDNVVRWY